MNNQLKNKEAFTLVEILVATFVFALMVFAISGIYLAFNSSQIRANASQQLLNDSQYAIETMANDIRNSVIVSFPNDIDCDTLIEPLLDGVISGCIILERSNDQVVAYVRHSESISSGSFRLYYLLLDCDQYYSSCQPIDLASGNAISILSPEINNINLTSLRFDMSPSANPYLAGGPNYQPKVTINMDAAYNSGNEVENVSHIFQTTVSSRVYRR